jgi:hypothetical protein
MADGNVFHLRRRRDQRTGKFMLVPAMSREQSIDALTRELDELHHDKARAEAELNDALDRLEVVLHRIDGVEGILENYKENDDQNDDDQNDDDQIP